MTNRRLGRDIIDGACRERPCDIPILPGAYGRCREFARRNRVLLLKTADGVGIDVSLGALPLEELAELRYPRLRAT